MVGREKRAVKLLIDKIEYTRKTNIIAGIEMIYL